MKLDDIKQTLETAGFKIIADDRLKNDTGTQLRTESGQTVNVYDSGKVVCGGKDKAAIEALLQDAGSLPAAKAKPSKKIFVVYGHDGTARTQLEAILRRWGLDPIILDQLPSEGQTIIEKLESLVDDVKFAVVLATPDDQGHRRDHPDEKAYRARQNVVLELGMLLARLGRRRVAILLKQQENMERPSDIQGLIYIPFKDDVQEARLLLAKEMNAQGFSIDIAKL